jgi:ribosomal protein S18 acetylase RimI-like enzyme
LKLEWSVRDASQQDVSRIYDLATASFGSDPNSIPLNFSYGHLEWLFLQNPAGHFKACVAHVGEKLVGFYGVLPMRLYYCSKEIDGSLSMLTMTHPDYRRQGMFQVLASQLYRELEERGTILTYGFPNENSLPGFVSKLEWKHIGTLDLYVRPLRTTAIIQKFVNARWVSSAINTLSRPALSIMSAGKEKDFRIRGVKQLDSRANTLMVARRDKFRVQQIRDSAYLNWRYATCPDWKYHITIAENADELLGYLVLRIVQHAGFSGGMIMDLSIQPGRMDVALALVRGALVSSDEGGMDLVACLANVDRDIMQALRRHWFVRVPKRFGLKNWYFGARLNGGHLLPTIVNDPQSWFLTFGDDDVL